MKHFAVIQSLCRIGLEDGNPKFRKQVKRLLERLEKEGMSKEVDTLLRLLNSSQTATELKPSKVELSRTLFSGEPLTSNVHPPVDKETSAPLADIIFVSDAEKINPIFEPSLKNSVDGVIEEWSHFKKLQKMGVAPSRSCLLFGEPGTGKTLTAYYMAQKMGLPLVSARLDGLVSSYLGTTARNIANLFEFANRYQCVLLLDEFDAIAKLRDDPQEVGEIKRVVNTLLQNLDNRSNIGVTIAITNHENLLDPAIWRRFEVRIAMPLPQYEQRRVMTEHYLKPMKLKDEVVDFLAWISEGYSGSDIKNMLNFVKRAAALSSNKKSEIDVVPVLSSYAHTNARSIKKGYFHLLEKDQKALVRKICNETNHKFTQKNIGEVLNKDQTTISRWLNEESGLEEVC